MYDFLTSPTGIELTHAVILVLVALAAYLSAKAKAQSASNEKLLNGHLQAHVAQLQAEQKPSELPDTGVASDHT